MTRGMTSRHYRPRVLLNPVTEHCKHRGVVLIGACCLAIVGGVIGNEFAGTVGAIVGITFGGVLGGCAGRSVAGQPHEWHADVGNLANSEALGLDELHAAYHYGAMSRHLYPDQSWEDAEQRMSWDWETRRGELMPPWYVIREACRAGWQRIEQRL